MVVSLNLKISISRIGLLLAAVVVFGFFIKIVIDEFAIFALADDRIQPDIALLAAANNFRPDSPRILARLADAETKEARPDLASAQQHILQAIDRSPNNYNYRLLLSEIKEQQGDLTGAEDALNEALRLAPNDHVSHWRIGNLLIREGRTDDAVSHFHFVAKFNEIVLPQALDLVWQISGHNIPALTEIVKDNPRTKLKLACFLATKSDAVDAANIFSDIDRDTVISSADTPLFFDALISKGFPKAANDLWLKLRNDDTKNINQSSVWNGSFESEPLPALKQFEWRLEKSEYAKVAVDANNSHSGKHSLLIDFSGRDTTRLDNEVKHLVVLRQGVSYQLEFFVKTENFFTPDSGSGVIVVMAPVDNPGNGIAQSKQISPGTADWQQSSFTFVAPRNPADGTPLFISIKRQPRYSYDEPTRGRIWFDDFTLREVTSK